MDGKGKIELCSPPDREKLVVHVMIDDEQWLELNQENEELELEFYPRRDGQPWKMSFDKALHFLMASSVRLTRGKKSVLLLDREQEDYFEFEDGEISVWLEDKHSLHMRAVTNYGDPAELTAETARDLAKALIELADEAEKDEE